MVLLVELPTNHETATEYVGPLLIGTFLNIGLFGMCLMQAHSYSQRCTNDATWVKWTVALLVLMEAVSCAFASFVAYDYAVRDFGLPSKVLVRTPEFSAFILTIGICSTITQSFYAWRVKRLLGTKWLAYGIWVSAGAQFLCVTGVAAGDSIVTGFLAFQQFKPVRVIVMIWMTLAPVTDLFIAGLLVWFLRRSRTGLRKTDTVLNKLVLLTVQTGAVTAIAALIGLLLFLTIPDFVHLIFIFILPELYGVCMMSSLNARSEWRDQLSGGISYVSRSGTNDIRESQSHSAGSRSAVQITKSTVTHNDPTFELSSVRGQRSNPRVHVSNIPLDFTHKEEYGELDDVKRYGAETFRHDLGPQFASFGEVTAVDERTEAGIVSGEHHAPTPELSTVPPAVRR